LIKKGIVASYWAPTGGFLKTHATRTRKGPLGSYQRLCEFNIGLPSAYQSSHEKNILGEIPFLTSHDFPL